MKTKRLIAAFTGLLAALIHLPVAQANTIYGLGLDWHRVSPSGEGVQIESLAKIPGGVIVYQLIEGGLQQASIIGDGNSSIACTAMSDVTSSLLVLKCWTGEGYYLYAKTPHKPGILQWVLPGDPKPVENIPAEKLKTKV